MIWWKNEKKDGDMKKKYLMNILAFKVIQ